MKRREFLAAMAGALSAGARGRSETPRKRLGVGIHSYPIRGKGKERARFTDPLQFLDHCHGLGAGGIQVMIGIRPAEYTENLRKKAESYGMFVEGQGALPRDKGRLDRFEAVVRSIRAAGAPVMRIALGDRRYEEFETLEQFKEFAKQAWKSLCLAEPVLARHGVHLAVENHKDFRVPELLDMMRRLSSEHVGVCVDTGNSIALLEDPMEVVEAYAPWARAVHLKDACLGPYDDGVLLGDPALGEGILDLRRMVNILREARPELEFVLEMITRDPLEVPCLTERYWATLPDVPGRDLASTLRLARRNPERNTLPRVSHLPRPERLRMVDENIRRSLAYAREHLEL